MLKIGNLLLKSNLILAPMSGISDLPFRLLNRKFGCEFAFVEMINVRSLGYKSQKTRQMLSSTPLDRPLGVQILGKEEKYILRGLDILKQYEFDILDFNAACPEKKVTKRGEGASLLKEPKKLSKLLKLLVKNSPVPVTVKIRTGWDKYSVNAKDVACYAQEAGVKALFIHGRTKMQGYSGTVDYEVVRQVKNALEIPVIASGDILSVHLAKKMFDETGCDGLLVARGALGNPWIFRQITGLLTNNTIPQKPDQDEIIRTIIEHLDACIDFYGERIGVIVFRKFFSWYTKGFWRIRLLREIVYRAKTRVDMICIMEKSRAVSLVN